MIGRQDQHHWTAHTIDLSSLLCKFESHSTSIMTSKSVPNRGFVCLMISCRFCSPVLALVGAVAVTLCLAFSYTSLSFLEPGAKINCNDKWLDYIQYNNVSECIEEEVSITSCFNSTFRLTFRIFVVLCHVFSVVTPNTFSADILPHRPLVHTDLLQYW